MRDADHGIAKSSKLWRAGDGNGCIQTHVAEKALQTRGILHGDLVELLVVPHTEQNETAARTDADALKAVDVLEHDAAQRGAAGEHTLKGGLGNAGLRQGELGEEGGGGS